MDRHDWHHVYDDPDSVLGRRLRTVRARIAEALDAAPPGGIKAVSVCAGQGHDLLGVLAAHQRRADVRARLVELDPRNAAEARATAAGLGLGDCVAVVTGDAALVRNYSRPAARSSGPATARPPTASRASATGSKRAASPATASRPPTSARPSRPTAAPDRRPRSRPRTRRCSRSSGTTCWRSGRGGTADGGAGLAERRDG
ncbi:hypothetical protein [Streptomyces sp. GZWMJZ-114]|uniref:hypothetical protein n=1 Tax=Streptomyces sp. GZWMJZ-114 TaxID=2494734 RepID=UPI00321FBD32